MLENIFISSYGGESHMTLEKTSTGYPLVNLKWEIWEHMGLQSRSTIEEGYSKFLWRK